MKIQIDNAYVIEYGEANLYQSYFLEFDLMDDMISNVEEWNNFFKSLKNGKSVTLTIEQKDEEL
jgi:hypothetical protein